ncbi:MAG: alpha/beta hydrolase [Chlamydiota bacterium]
MGNQSLDDRIANLNYQIHTRNTCDQKEYQEVEQKLQEEQARAKDTRASNQSEASPFQDPMILEPFPVNRGSVSEHVLFLARCAFALLIDFIAGSYFVFIGFVYCSDDWNEEPIDPEKPTWIFLHGKGSRRGSFLPISTSPFFKKQANIRMMNLEPKLLFSNFHTDSLEVYVDRVEKKIEQVMQEINKACTKRGWNPKMRNQKVHILAHSMGGAVSLGYIAKHPENVGRFVCMASPLRGAPVAYMQRLWIQLAEELLPGSPYLQNLRKKSLLSIRSQRISMTVLCGEMDLLTPSRYVAFPGAQRKVHRWIGHVGILFSAFFWGLPEIFARTKDQHKTYYQRTIKPV